MACNVGKKDKKFRLVIGVAMLIGGMFVGKAWLGSIGIILVVTAVINFCPLYKMLNIKTCDKSKK